MRDFLLTARAFFLPQTNFQESAFQNFLAGFYTKRRFPWSQVEADTPCYIRSQKAYRRQLTVLLNALNRLFEEEKSEDGKEAVRLARDNLKAQNFFAAEEYFGKTKALMERVFFILKDLRPPQRGLKVREYGSRILACGAGIFTQSALTLQELLSQENIPWWVTRARENILELLQVRMSGRNDVHCRIALLQLAESYAWGIPGIETVADYEDQAHYRVRLTPDDSEDFVLLFEKDFSIGRVVSVVKLHFRELLSQYKDLDLSPPDPSDPEKHKA